MKHGKLIYGESFDQYAARVGMSATKLKPGLKSMKAMHYAAEHGREDTSSLAFGRLAHRCVLEGAIQADQFAVWDGRKAGKAYEAHVESATADGKTVVSAGEMEELTAIVKAVHSNKFAARIINETAHEVSCLWPHKLGQAKCRFDCISDAWLGDFKTCSKADIVAFESQAYRLGYHLQLAHYLDGAHACKIESPRVRIIATESSPPFDTVVFMLDESLIEIGLTQRDSLWAKYKAAQKANQYPGIFDQGEAVLSVPAWAQSDLDFVRAVDIEEGDPAELFT